MSNNKILQFPADIESKANFSFLSFSAFVKVAEKSDSIATDKANGSIEGTQSQTDYSNPHTAYLYIPGTMSDNTSFTYEDESLGAMGNLGNLNVTYDEYLSKAASRSLSAMGQNALGAVEGLTGLKVKGAWEYNSKAVLNPQMVVLFKNVGFREHSFTFDMFPKNASEAREIKSIVRMFKYYAHPYISGDFMQYPAWWQIEAKRGKSRTPIRKFHRAVITSCNVEENPTGVWATFEDGSPINTKVTLNFKEIKQTMRDNISLDITDVESF